MKPSNLLLTLTLFLTLTLTQVTPLTHHIIKTLAVTPLTQNPPSPPPTVLAQKIPTDLKNLSEGDGIVQVAASPKKSEKKELTAAAVEQDSIVGSETYDQLENILRREIKKVSTSESKGNELNNRRPPIPVTPDQAYAESALLGSLMKGVVHYLKKTKISENYQGEDLLGY
jgi:hypothetical protein